MIVKHVQRETARIDAIDSSPVLVQLFWHLKDTLPYLNAHMPPERSCIATSVSVTGVRGVCKTPDTGS